jgi:hypothetical protein
LVKLVRCPLNGNLNLRAATGSRYRIRDTKLHDNLLLRARYLLVINNMMLFGLGNLFYGISVPRCRLPLRLANAVLRKVSILLVNAIAILSEDRFLARSAYLPAVLSVGRH